MIRSQFILITAGPPFDVKGAKRMGLIFFFFPDLRFNSTKLKERGFDCKWEILAVCLTVVPDV